jgi:hypothetical protein
MLNPSVGLMMLVSSPFILSTIVVFPELSKPLHRNQEREKRSLPTVEGKREGEKKGRKREAYTMRMRISFSLRLIFRMILRSPIREE